ncbi:MAG: hypothetical protein PHF26_01660 [Candidatus Gracilibacteria bacterium]|nr:hypothetical protein [Candidatus Gracilibacteria bacterium]
MENKNPFNEGTQIYKIFEILSDLRWHCSEHELPGSQPAKALQMIRQAGYTMEKIGANYEKRIFCEVCQRNTPHRKLISLEQEDVSVERTKTLDSKLKERIIKLFGNKDAFLDYEPTGRKIEVDHRIPQVRWLGKEESYIDMTDGELVSKFMLLVREHNLLKSRYCERCKRTSKRQAFLGVNYFYEGGENYEEKFGCNGCGWFSPEKWREKLNKKLTGN